jgi:hypothetical protein
MAYCFARGLRTATTFLQHDYQNASSQAWPYPSSHNEIAAYILCSQILVLMHNNRQNSGLIVMFDSCRVLILRNCTDNSELPVADIFILLPHTGLPLRFDLRRARRIVGRRR